MYDYVCNIFECLVSLIFAYLIPICAILWFYVGHYDCDNRGGQARIVPSVMEMGRKSFDSADEGSLLH